MRNRAINALLEMGMPADLRGFEYICDAMEMLQDDKTRSGGVVALYTLIANKHNVTASGVERTIRYAFSMVLKEKSDAAEKYFSGSRASNGSLLAVFYVRLEQEGERNESNN